MAKLPVLGRQLDRCDVCGVKIHRKDLVRTQVRFVDHEGNNYFTYSSYNSGLWACSAVDTGVISYGPHGDEQRISISDDNTLTRILGSQTWAGDGVFRNTSGVDVSSWTSFCVNAEFGIDYRYSSNIGYISEATVQMGICDGDGNNKSLKRTWSSMRSQRRIWFTMNVADIAAPLSSSALYVYFSVDIGGSEYWFLDDIALEKNVTSPGTFKRTLGSSRVVAADTKSMAVCKVCPRCRERLLLESEQYGRPMEERVEYPVDVDLQEV